MYHVRMNKRFSIIALATLLCSCQTAIPSTDLQDSDDYSNVGLDIEWGTLEETDNLATEGDEAPSVETIDAVAELQDSYNAAIAVRDLMLDVVVSIDGEQQDVIRNAIEAFSADIDALKYYVDTATYDELTNEEHEELIKITKGIDDGMAVFGDILELVL